MRRIVCHDTGEVVFSYDDYLKTDHWFDLRKECLEVNCHICAECKQPDRQLQVHHLHYRTIGNESMSDIRPLCDSCHAREHESEEQREEIKSRLKELFKSELKEVAAHKQRPKSVREKQLKKRNPKLRTHYTRYRYKDGKAIALCLEEAVQVSGFALTTEVTQDKSKVTCKLCLSKMWKLNIRNGL